MQPRRKVLREPHVSFRCGRSQRPPPLQRRHTLAVVALHPQHLDLRLHLQPGDDLLVRLCRCLVEQLAAGHLPLGRSAGEGARGILGGLVPAAALPLVLDL
ncbi:MAG: hypothetical protein WD794_14690 [Mycobacteriales bacterium]